MYFYKHEFRSDQVCSMANKMPYLTFCEVYSYIFAKKKTIANLKLMVNICTIKLVNDQQLI